MNKARVLLNNIQPQPCYLLLLLSNDTGGVDSPLLSVELRRDLSLDCEYVLLKR